MNKYKYTGTVETELTGYGVVKPNQIIEVEFKIDNPLFEEVKELKKEEKSQKNND